jgi:hypothetical protein
MLTIKTDIENKNWLIYILDEFKNINIANFDIEVLLLDEFTFNENIIYYISTSTDQVSIFNSSEQTPSKKIEYLKDNLYILENTRSENFSISYDILWNTFVFLSRYEEYFSEKNGKNIYSYSLNHPRNDKDSFDIPIVNILFNELELFIKENFPKLDFGDKIEPIIDLSHDIDYINKTIQIRLKQTVFNLYKTLKVIHKPKIFINNLIKTFKFAFSNPSYWCFDYWTILEKNHNKRSIFYVYVKNGKKDFKSWLIDPSYDIKTNTKLQKKLKALKNDGFEIGLHGSYYSANDFNKLKKEKEILENILGFKIVKTRQHWLNYFEKVTPYSHNKLFKLDSTLAWNDRIGFRSGCVSLYRPYDFKSEKAFDYEIMPQVIMDSNVYDYSDSVEIFNKAKNIMQKSKGLSKTTHVSISWHQRVCSSDYSWHKFYEEILNDI